MTGRLTRAEQLAARRAAQIKAIQTYRRALGIDEETYRAMVLRVSTAHGTPCTSSKDLNPEQRAALLDELRGSGAKPGAVRPTYPGKPANWKELPEYASKVEALLTDMGLSWAYADAICKRQCGIARVGWIKKDAHWIALIAALSVEQFKRAAGVQIDAELKRKGIKEADIPLQLPRNWKRNVGALKAVGQWLDLNMLLKALADMEAQ